MKTLGDIARSWPVNLGSPVDRRVAAILLDLVQREVISASGDSMAGVILSDQTKQEMVLAWRRAVTGGQPPAVNLSVGPVHGVGRTEPVKNEDLNAWASSVSFLTPESILTLHFFAETEQKATVGLLTVPGADSTINAN